MLLHRDIPLPICLFEVIQYWCKISGPRSRWKNVSGSRSSAGSTPSTMCWSPTRSRRSSTREELEWARKNDPGIATADRPMLPKVSLCCANKNTLYLLKRFKQKYLFPFVFPYPCSCQLKQIFSLGLISKWFLHVRLFVWRNKSMSQVWLDFSPELLGIWPPGSCLGFQLASKLLIFKLNGKATEMS